MDRSRVVLDWGRELAGPRVSDELSIAGSLQGSHRNGGRYVQLHVRPQRQLHRNSDVPSRPGMRHGDVSGAGGWNGHHPSNVVGGQWLRGHPEQQLRYEHEYGGLRRHDERDGVCGNLRSDSHAHESDRGLEYGARMFDEVQRFGGTLHNWPDVRLPHANLHPAKRGRALSDHDVCRKEPLLRYAERHSNLQRLRLQRLRWGLLCLYWRLPGRREFLERVRRERLLDVGRHVVGHHFGPLLALQRGKQHALFGSGEPYLQSQHHARDVLGRFIHAPADRQRGADRTDDCVLSVTSRKRSWRRAWLVGALARLPRKRSGGARPLPPTAPQPHARNVARHALSETMASRRPRQRAPKHAY